MKVFGREVRFLRTVEANFKLEEISPNHDINRMGELFDGNLTQSTETAAKMMCILSEAYEKRQKFVDPEYEAHPLTMEEILVLNDAEFNALNNECIAAMTGQQTVEVESEPKKKETASN